MAAVDLDALAERLFAAFVAHDLPVARAMFADDATVTQNGRTLPIDEMLVEIAALRGVLGDHRYEDVRRVIGDGAVVEEHRVVSTTPAGDPVDLTACVVIRVDDAGLITEVDEYVDLSRFPG